ncbi:hypothetical protein [Thermoanaerobacterium sp. RBIITD]|uniref:coiled-coil domain-containing protein n=1 Tax=Thermoanaerobacterium sp. RBIITD TaxID=1550240 RepID=UPI000BB988D5|nr:hypothetical protein [Thermoanaerobacterium sp. RBIITD]SNX55175.1 hypothetical protein SAMN05660242_2971 [Thermoanaerobacterium sp. RBIITD]
MKRIVIIIIIFALSFSMIKTTYSDPVLDLKNAESEEQKIILDLLNLDMERTKSIRELDQINAEISKINAQINLKNVEIISLNQNIKNERNRIKGWFRFLYMDGTNTILSLILMSSNAVELLHRIIYIDIITNYFYSKLDHINYLLKNKKAEEISLNNQKNDLNKKQHEQNDVINKINQLKISKTAMLEDIRKRIADYQKILNISDSIDMSLPSLDYLLNNLSKLPWETLKPVNIDYSLFSISAVFSDKSINDMINNYDDKLKGIGIKFDGSGFTLSDQDNYTLKGNFAIDGGKVKLDIKSIDIKGIAITGDYLNNMLRNYNTTLNFESPLVAYKLSDVKTSEGNVIFTLSK